MSSPAEVAASSIAPPADVPGGSIAQEGDEGYQGLDDSVRCLDDPEVGFTQLMEEY